MKIEFLGHAGFCVETQSALIVMDPWLSEGGSSDAAWFQFPCNHHLAEPLIRKLRESTKLKFLYVSHEHPDHCDLAFLARLPTEEMHLLTPHFSRARFQRLLALFSFKERTVFRDRQRLALPGGVLELLVEDTGLDSDSGIFVRAGSSTFLNVNDCKLTDRMPAFRREHGPIDVLAGQFSGATWHPACYVLEPESYRQISEAKVRNKFETVAQSIEMLEPKRFLGSAGPPCFLDPRLAHISREEGSSFPRLDAIRAFLDVRLPRSSCQWPDLLPGDVLDVTTQEFEAKSDAPYPPTREGLLTYLAAYAERAAPHVEQLTRLALTTDPRAVLDDLRTHLQEKLDVLALRESVSFSLFFGVDELPGEWVLVDFAAGTTTHLSGLTHPSERLSEYYSIVSPAWQVKRAVEGTISWEYWSSTFRAKLERKPDRYDTVLNAFLFLEKEDLPAFSDKLIALQKGGERIEILAGGCVYEVNRLCPHQGGDLKAGWVDGERFLVCPKHQWKFDLTNGGRCATNASTIRATRKQ